MKSLLNSFFRGLLLIAPYILVLFVLLNTYMAITAATSTLALFHAFTACIHVLCLYYIQTRNDI